MICCVRKLQHSGVFLLVPPKFALHSVLYRHIYTQFLHQVHSGRKYRAHLDMRLNNSRNFNLFLKRFFTSFSGSSSETLRTTVFSIRHRTCVHSSTRSRGTQSSESKISGELLSHTLITMSVAGGAAGTVSRENLKENERRAVIDELLEGSKNGKLAHGDIKRVTQQFACSRKQVTTVWNRYKEQKDAGIAAQACAINVEEIRAGKESTWKSSAINSSTSPSRIELPSELLLHSWGSRTRP